MDHLKTNMYRLSWLFLFSIAMGFFEASVVIYLRELYYPEGFSFPLQAMDTSVVRTELIREAASILMLISLAFLAVRNATQRFGVFLIAFAVWDITYYLFLKLLLGWPSSLFTWDILFLIPVTWTGPVIAPIIHSLTMILLGTSMYHFGAVLDRAMPGKPEWTLLLAGTSIALFVYMEDFSRYMLRKYSLAEWFELPTPPEVLEYALAYIPIDFNWMAFLLGEILFLTAIIWYLRRMMRKARVRIL